ncbi:acylphosphatase [Halothermothrix orenii]|uniref:Acylphosphatase n=1 Tax=Halothermothrix orenii (strain H 168 / OCM 544 / DSM 9562) TaxID=373903 RepID=B8CWD0_HALOH|nr:acylphosphatase [Halothermothrix orenii]ACL69599.1 cylphosphatase [Halothermothrix orenii H 168]
MNQTKPVKKHVYISGRVQGVGFRSFLKSNAARIGINGWVKNLPDGRVEAVFAGEKEKVARILQLAKEGPAWARVDNIEEEDQPYKNDYNGFKIKF